MGLVPSSSQGGGGTVTSVAAGDTSITVAGTAADPTVAVAALGITDAKVAAANKDGTAATPSLRTLGAGAQQACAGNDSRLTPVVASVFARTGAVAAANADYYGVVSAALTGATAASRHAGATASGAPVAGTFAVGDFVVDQTGSLWICTVAGTPGAWVRAGAAASRVVLFESTITGVDAASIDTGVNGIAGGYRRLEVEMLSRTDEAGALVAVNITFNNDGSAIYDRITTALGFVVGDTKLPVNTHGSGGLANNPGIVRLFVPDYAQTTFNKVGRGFAGVPDSTGAFETAVGFVFGYRSTTAISQLKVAAVGAAKLKVGSHLVIYGVT